MRAAGGALGWATLEDSPHDTGDHADTAVSWPRQKCPPRPGPKPLLLSAWRQAHLPFQGTRGLRQVRPGFTAISSSFGVEGTCNTSKWTLIQNTDCPMAGRGYKVSRQWLTQEFQALDDSDLRMTQPQGAPSVTLRPNHLLWPRAGPEPRRACPSAAPAQTTPRCPAWSRRCISKGT